MRKTLLKIFNWASAQLEHRAALWQGKGWGSCTIFLEVEMAARLLGSAPRICVDVGGNKGHYAEALLSKFPEASIVIFEPSTANIEILNLKFSDNLRVEIENFAISEKKGISKLFSDKPGSGLASLSNRKLDHFGIHFNYSEKVRTEKFENYWFENLNRAEIDLVKLDIEGHELEALRGMGEALRHIRLIQFEFGGCNIDTKTYFKDFWYFFRNHGFEIFRMGPLGVIQIDNYSERDEYFSTTNYFARRTDLPSHVVEMMAD